MVYSFHTLPVEIVYRILDNLDEKTLFISCRGVCKKLNDIMDTYEPYQVKSFIQLFDHKFIISITPCSI